MPRNYIDFISAYCDSWCERCAFTQRCSHFAVKVAEGMCEGDLNAAIELAIGRPCVPGGLPQKPIQQGMAEAFDDVEMDEQELKEIGREIEARRSRVRRHSLAKASLDYSIATHRWLEKHRELDAKVKDAVEVITWDHFLIHVKINRALNGRDECPDGGPFGSVVQNDWNGSAKVALISIDRSERAWRKVAAALSDDAAGVLGDALASLRQKMLREFPKVMAFKRPGFDDTGNSASPRNLRQ